MQKEENSVSSGPSGPAPQIRVIALSTCFFCDKIKKMLDKQGFSYTSVDIDLLPEEERKMHLEQIRKFNPEESFPIVIIDKVAIVGFKEERIKQELRIA